LLFSTLYDHAMPP